MEIPIKMDDLGVPLFSETPTSSFLLRHFRVGIFPLKEGPDVRCCKWSYGAPIKWPTINGFAWGYNSTYRGCNSIYNE